MHVVDTFVFIDLSTANIAGERMSTLVASERVSKWVETWVVC